MNRNILDIKRNKEILKYSLCVSASLTTILGLNVINTLAAPSDNNNNPGVPNYSVSNAENNALSSIGVRDYETVKNHVDFYTPDGQLASQDYIESVANKGNMEEYLVVKYKDDADSQKLGQVFGSNGAAMQDYLDKQGSNYTQGLDSLLDIQNQMSNILGSVTTTSGDSSTSMYWDPVTKKATIKEGSDFSKVVNNGNLDQLNELAQKWYELTGNTDILSMTQGELETIISKTDRPEDVNAALTANKRTFDAITKIRFTITNKSTGGPATNVSADQAGTQQLLNQYNSSWISKYRSMTGTAIPSLQQVGAGVFEIDIGSSLYSMDDKWTKILKNWTVGAGGGNFLGVGMFDITPTSDPLVVKVEVVGDRYTYYENVSKQATYPTGYASSSQSVTNDGSNYTFKDFKNSYYYGKYEGAINASTGTFEKLIGRVPNYKVKAEKKTRTTYTWASENRINWSKLPFDYYRNEDGTRQVFWYKKYYTETYYTKLIYDRGARYTGTESINNGDNRGDRPLYSADDGASVRDIWFKTQYIRYWDYKDEIKTGSDAYSDAPYVVSKYAHSSITDTDQKPLVRFASENDRIKGVVMTTEKASGWAAPSKIETRLLKETTWELSPLSGKIRIPVLTQTGEMQGVINESGMNIN